MRLVIERLVGNLPFGLHTAGLYSLSHYFVQNGDLMADPEMCFIVVDNRRETKEYELTFIVPYMYHVASAAIYEESIIIENRIIPDRYIRPMQLRHAAFANQWLENVRQQGFLTQLQNGSITQISDTAE